MGIYLLVLAQGPSRVRFSVEYAAKTTLLTKYRNCICMSSFCPQATMETAIDRLFYRRTSSGEKNTWVAIRNQGSMVCPTSRKSHDLFATQRHLHIFQSQCVCRGNRAGSETGRILVVCIKSGADYYRIIVNTAH